MAFDSFSDFLAMGGYAMYVWPVVFITLISFLFLYVSSKKRNQTLLKGVIKEQQRQARIEAAKELTETL